MQRVSEIPKEIAVINPGYDMVNLVGLATIEGRSYPRGKPVKGRIQLHKYPEPERARLYQAIKNCIFGQILIEDKEVTDTDIDLSPVEGAQSGSHSHSGPITPENDLRAPNAPKEEITPADDFSVITGITPLVAKRLVSLGIRTYEMFLGTDVKALLRIEGLNQENIDVIIAAMAAKITPPDPETINPPPPPQQINNDILPGRESISPNL